MNKPSEIIKFDKYLGRIQQPNILLMNRSFHILGKISRYDNWHASIVANGLNEIVLNVHKYEDGRLCPVWDDLVDLKIVDVDGFGRFEISVNYTDNTETVKSVHGFSLENELAQINLNDFHVNDEEATDMVITEYSKDNYDEEGNFIPTVFYNPNDEKRSLLHRVLADKTPHWSIGYVTPYITLGEDVQPEKSFKFQRTYTVDGDSIYDFLTGTVSEESNVIFIFDTINRLINCYSLCDCINQETGEVLCKGIGEDTFVFASKRNLANEITISSNKDKIKNCFRIEGGDDVITDMVRAVNMNGSNYIYQFADFQYNDMSEELRDKIKTYQETMSSQDIQDEYYGEYGIYTRLCKAYDDLAYYESSMMPNTDKVTEPGTAKEQYDKVVDELTAQGFHVAVSSVNNYNGELFVGITNNVEAYAQVLLDSRFDISIVDGSASYNSDTKTWKGKIRVVQHTDEKNVYPVDLSTAPFIEVKINDDVLEFAKQKVHKALSKSSMSGIDFHVAGMDKAEMEEYFNQYSLNRLKSFYDGYNSCLSILAEMGQSTASDVQKELYKDYEVRFHVVESVLEFRQNQVNDTKRKIGNIQKDQREFQNRNDFYSHLGDKLYKEFCSYRREDTYTNSNYISDGLSTSECLAKAKELVEAAIKEAKKACVLQRTVSVSLGNLLALPEFEPLWDSFALYNYIRVKTEDEILKLRLIGVEFDGDTPENIEVTFSEQIKSIDGTMSDLQSVFKQAKSISTSYPSTALQAKQGSEAKNEITDMYEHGLNASKTMLTNNDNNEVTINASGILCKRMDDEGHYGGKQLRITGNIMALTDDGWKTVKMGIGESVFYNPFTKKYELKYGIQASVIVGELMCSENMFIGNKNGSVKITGDGIEISNGVIKSSDYTKDESGKETGSIIDLRDGSFSFADGGLSYQEGNLVLKDGIIKSVNYIPYESGSMIDLTNGNFNFAGNGLIYDGDNQLQVKGDIKATSIVADYAYKINDNGKEIDALQGFLSEQGLWSVRLWINENSYIELDCTEDKKHSNIRLNAKNIHLLGNTYSSTGQIISSDRNLKHDIHELDKEKSSKFIYSLKPSKFKYNNGTSDRFHHGFIAQEVKESLGEEDNAVYVEQKDGTKGLRYEELIADLVATVQMQNERIKVLEEKLDSMK